MTKTTTTISSKVSESLTLVVSSVVDLEGTMGCLEEAMLTTNCTLGRKSSTVTKRNLCVLYTPKLTKSWLLIGDVAGLWALVYDELLKMALDLVKFTAKNGELIIKHFI